MGLRTLYFFQLMEILVNNFFGTLFMLNTFILLDYVNLLEIIKHLDHLGITLRSYIMTVQIKTVDLKK